MVISTQGKERRNLFKGNTNLGRHSNSFKRLDFRRCDRKKEYINNIGLEKDSWA